MKSLNDIRLVKLIINCYLIFLLFSTNVQAGILIINVGNTTMHGGNMVLGDNINDTSLFCVVNSTGSWTLSVQDNDAATKTTSPGPLSVGNMTNWSAAGYSSPWLQKNLTISGQGFGGPYVSLSGTAQQIASGLPVTNMTIPLFYKQTIIGGDRVPKGGGIYRIVVLFTGTST
jgi:hypothetical protein